MFTKSCPFCRTDSYCATNQKPWLCPKCQEDISSNKSVLKMKSEKVKELSKLHKKEEASAMSYF